jgi:hypothetical protein
LKAISIVHHFHFTAAIHHHRQTPTPTFVHHSPQTLTPTIATRLRQLEVCDVGQRNLAISKLLATCTYFAI